jgi:hypothetical protein
MNRSGSARPRPLTRLTAARARSRRRGLPDLQPPGRPSARRSGRGCRSGRAQVPRRARPACLTRGLDRLCPPGRPQRPRASAPPAVVRGSRWRSGDPAVPANPCQPPFCPRAEQVPPAPSDHGAVRSPAGFSPALGVHGRSLPARRRGRGGDDPALDGGLVPAAPGAARLHGGPGWKLDERNSFGLLVEAGGRGESLLLLGHGGGREQETGDDDTGW